MVLSGLSAAITAVFEGPHDKNDVANRIATILKEKKISPDDVRKVAVFDDEKYSRVLVAFHSSYTILLCCFLPGQATPRHTHGDEQREAVVTVIEGSVSLSLFENSSSLTPKKVENWKEGDVIPLGGDLGEHSLGNNGETPAITLHVYHPPYISCCFLKQGHETSLPPIYGPQTACDTKEHLSRSLSAGFAAFSNLPSLIQTLRDSILPLPPGGGHSEEHIEEIKSLLSKIHLNKEEWLQYSRFSTGKYTRNLIGYDNKFNALLLCWEKGQMSPIHDHAGSSCWVKVLHGNLREVRYKTPNGYKDEANKAGNGPLEVISDQKFPNGGVAYINDTRGLHMMGNAESDDVAVSLHIYSPPYSQCYVFDAASGAAKIATVIAANQPDCPFAEKIGEIDLNAAPDSPPSPPSDLTLAKFSELTEKAIDAQAFDDLPPLLEKLTLAQKEWSTYVHFDEARYTRSLIINHGKFSLMLLSWNKGQSTPIHSHGEGTRAYFRVLKGSLAMTVFGEGSDGSVDTVLTPSSGVSPCCIPTSSSSNLLHKVSNLSSEETAISLHLYTPPYIECRYEIRGQPQMIPVVYCGGDKIVASPTLEHNLRTQSRVFTNLPALLAFLNSPSCPSSVKDVTRALTAFDVHVEEVIQYLQAKEDVLVKVESPCGQSAESLPTMSVIAVGEDVTLVACKWREKVSMPPVDYDGSKMWLKVLSGTIREVSFDSTGGEGPLEIAREGSLRANDVAYFGAKVVHSLTADSKDGAIALMVFKTQLHKIYRHCIQTNKRCLLKNLTDSIEK